MCGNGYFSSDHALREAGSSVDILIEFLCVLPLARHFQQVNVALYIDIVVTR